jgi:hypothetical protein
VKAQLAAKVTARDRSAENDTTERDGCILRAAWTTRAPLETGLGVLCKVS